MSTIFAVVAACFDLSTFVVFTSYYYGGAATVVAAADVSFGRLLETLLNIWVGALVLCLCHACELSCECSLLGRCSVELFELRDCF